jgi:hypothetical protein
MFKIGAPPIVSAHDEDKILNSQIQEALLSGTVMVSIDASSIAIKTCIRCHLMHSCLLQKYTVSVHNILEKFNRHRIVTQNSLRLVFSIVYFNSVNQESTTVYLRF